MKIAIVGASGAVGQELLKVLEHRNFPVSELVLFGSKRSSGKKYLFRGESYIVKELKHNDDFKNIDIALVSAGGGTSIEFAPTITKCGAIMIDNSSAFRMDDQVPLVVPEVNPEDAFRVPKNIIANPNCSTIQMVLPLKAIENLSHITKVHVSTYQSASGAGAAAMDELIEQIKSIGQEKKPTIEKFVYQLALNLIPHIDSFTENGYTKEEMKMFNETQKILHSNIQVSATCVRVPVMRAHSESIWVETEEELNINQVYTAFKNFNGIIVEDEPENKKYPMPLYVAGSDEVFIGRIRKDLTNPKGITFWCVSDQIRKGAALNAVQIAELLLAKKSKIKMYI